jgi:eukaryotic-like serine/threonine-protein kinase
MPDDRVSHYRVVEKLGRGGMGVVYRAEDLTLGREAALKFLPEDVASDPVALERFEREARAAAAINHPNICTIYEIGEHEGRRFLAMELLQGEDLRSKIGGAPVRLPTLVDIGVQVASGLEAAHARGIVHRDIKPANLFVTRTGQAKILDFGLAKPATRAHAAGAAPDATATLAAEVTDPGSAIGTPSYMSPEQARGEDLDARTDLFSLGVVLYEMATGRQPFQGKTTGAVMGAIIHQTPAALGAGVPAGLESIIGKALEKDRDMRYQSAADLRADLKRLLRETESGHSPAHTSAPAVAAKRPRKWIWIAAAFAVTAAAAAGFVFFRPRPRIYFAQTQLTPVTRLGNAGVAALSTDGKYVAYSSAVGEGADIRMRQVKTGVDVEVVPPGPWRIRGITFSPDDYSVWVVRYPMGVNQSEVVQAPVVGGEARRVLTNVDTPVTFSPDGKRVAFQRGAPRLGESYAMVANADGSNERQLAIKHDPEKFSQVGPAWSPDGKRIAFAVTVKSGAAGQIEAQIALIDPDHGSQQFLKPANRNGIGRLGWTHDGSAVITSQYSPSSRSVQLWIIPFPTGAPRQVTSDLSNYSEAVPSADSTLISATRTSNSYHVWLLDGAGKHDARARRIDQLGGADVGYFAFNREGRLVYASFSPGGSEVAVMDPDGAHSRELTHGARPYELCVCGASLVFTSFRDGVTGLWRVDADGMNEKRLTSGPDTQPACSPDGNSVLFARAESGHTTVWRIAADGGEPQRVYDQWAFSPSFSPDGSQMAYAIQPDGQPASIVVRAASGQGPEYKVGAGVLPAFGRFRWSPDGKGFDLVRMQNGADNIWRVPLDGGPPRQITSFDSDRIFMFAWSADGKTLALARGSVITDVVLIRDTAAPVAK